MTAIAALTCLAFAVRDVRVAPGQWERSVVPVACSLSDAEAMRTLLRDIPAGSAVLLCVRDKNGQAVPLVTP